MKRRRLIGYRIFKPGKILIWLIVSTCRINSQINLPHPSLLESGTGQFYPTPPWCHNAQNSVPSGYYKTLGILWIRLIGTFQVYFGLVFTECFCNSHYIQTLSSDNLQFKPILLACGSIGFRTLGYWKLCLHASLQGTGVSHADLSTRNIPGEYCSQGSLRTPPQSRPESRFPTT